MVLLIILIVLVVIAFFLFKRSKRLKFDTILMINGTNGSGKSVVSVYRALSAFRVSHHIWYRRTHIWAKIPLINKLMRCSKYEEEPLLYSNIPIYSDKRHGQLFKYYCPLTNDIINRVKRPRYHSVILWDEASLMATSMDYKNKELSNNMSFFLKLLRHELKGANRNVFGSHCNLIVNTQSKNDTHYSIDRCINQVLYITKSMNIPFFKIIWVRDLLLIDSVNNEFNDDIKEDMTSRWFIVPKRIFNKYDSYSYEFLSHDLPVLDTTNCPVKVVRKGDKVIFEIATFHDWQEITKSNEELNKLIVDNINKESEDN